MRNPNEVVSKFTAERRSLLSLVCATVLVSLAVLTAWLLGREPSAALSGVAPATASTRSLQERATEPLRGHAADSPAPTAGDAVAVAAAVDAGRRVAIEEEERFLQDGWSFVKTTPPDAALLALEPALLPTRERDLRRQLETSSLTEDQVDHARLIAARATEARTRRAAIEGLGRVAGERAQTALRGLFDQLPADEDRRLLLGFVRPTSLGDASAAWLLSRLESPDLTDELKKQMTFALALASLAEQPHAEGEGAGLSSLLERVPPAWREAVTASYRAVASR